MLKHVQVVAYLQLCLIGHRGVLHIHLRSLLIVGEQVLSTELGDVRIETTQFLFDTLDTFVDEVCRYGGIAHLILLPLLLIYLYQCIQNGLGPVAALILISQTDDACLVIGKVDLQLFQTTLHLIISLLFPDADGHLVVLSKAFVEVLRLDHRHLAEWCLTHFAHLSADLSVEFILVLAELIQRKRTVFPEVHLHVTTVLLRQLWEGYLDG